MWGFNNNQPTVKVKESDDPAVDDDLCGKPAAVVSNPDIAGSLSAVQRELSKIPATEKAALAHAHSLKPEIFDDDHVLQFLWTEKFDAELAAKRLVRYWNDRFRLFGPDKFVLPLTLKGALKDDSLALSRGYVQLLADTDTAGRAVLYLDWSSHEPSIGYSEDSMHRVFWYMAHVAAEDPKILEAGFVLVIYPQEARLDQFDHSLWNTIADSCRFSLPIRWRATHVVHPNRFFSIIHPVFMASLPQDVQDRVIVHSGTKMKVLANLLRYCLPWDKIPADIGGCLDIEFDQWLSERMAKEDIQQLQKPSSITSSSSVFSSVLSSAEPITNPPPSDSNNVGGNPLEGQALGLLSQLMRPGQSSSSFPNPVASGMPPLPPLQPNSFPGNNNNSANQLFLDLVHSSNPAQLSNSAHGSNTSMSDADKKDDNNNKRPAKGPKSVIKSGRKSDPRMDAAVEAKINNPDLSLVDALKQGGFVFPNVEGASTPQYSVVDSDNVKITQRKNQLLRRLRSVKKKGGA
ncbi:hypothetical protein ACHAWC_002272 [Mediolabrus comicus]